MAEDMGDEEGKESSSMKAVWAPRAVRQLEAIRDYIAVDSEASAAQVVTRILKAVDLVETQPQMGRPGRLPGTRELVVNGTPYLIPYRVRVGRIELIAILDGHRHWPATL